MQKCNRSTCFHTFNYRPPSFHYYSCPSCSKTLQPNITVYWVALLLCNWHVLGSKVVSEIVHPDSGVSNFLGSFSICWILEDLSFTTYSKTVALNRRGGKGLICITLPKFYGWQRCRSEYMSSKSVHRSDWISNTKPLNGITTFLSF